MLISDIGIVRTAHIIMASASPRRSAILNEQLQCNVRAVPSTFAEDLDKGSFTPVEYAKETARQKALDVFGICAPPFLSKHNRPPSMVIGADTVVVLGDKVLEKPTSRDDARRMLRELSDAGTHTVCTGVSLLYGGTTPGATPHEHTFVEETTVKFKSLGEAEIAAYVDAGESMDKAGGYGIQGLGGLFVTGVEGDYQNVVGFPLARFCQELETARLVEWLDSAPPEPAVDAEEPSDPLAPIVSSECDDDEECGLPSD